METTTSVTDDVITRATEQAREGVSAEAAGAALLQLAGGDRRAVEAARDRVAARLRARVDDFEATATLTLLNRALAALPIHDPLDWKVRWTQRFRRP
jgi:hypothetical protein